MKTLIYQISVGQPSKLYQHCIASVKRYADTIDAAHFVQTEPILKIRPTGPGRSKEAVERLGYLPIFEKANAFAQLKTYDKVAIIDADVYVRPNVLENIFETFDEPFAAMKEASLPMQDWYYKKLVNYSRMQYGSLWKYPNPIAPFRNMGVMVLDKGLLDLEPLLATPYEFLTQEKFRHFVNGVGNWKWSTDQTLLNHWLHESKIPCHDLDWTWNCLYTTVDKDKLDKAKFIHFFLKDKLPQRGENVQQLMETIK